MNRKYCWAHSLSLSGEYFRAVLRLRIKMKLRLGPLLGQILNMKFKIYSQLQQQPGVRDATQHQTINKIWILATDDKL